MLNEEEYNGIWTEAIASVPSIGKSLKLANGIAIAKEMYRVGTMNSATYKKWLEQAFSEAGYELKKN